MVNKINIIKSEQYSSHRGHSWVCSENQNVTLNDDTALLAYSHQTLILGSSRNLDNAKIHTSFLIEFTMQNDA